MPFPFKLGDRVKYSLDSDHTVAAHYVVGFETERVKGVRIAILIALLPPDEPPKEVLEEGLMDDGAADVQIALQLRASLIGEVNPNTGQPWEDILEPLPAAPAPARTQSVPAAGQRRSRRASATGKQWTVIPMGVTRPKHIEMFGDKTKAETALVDAARKRPTLTFGLFELVATSAVSVEAVE